MYGLVAAVTVSAFSPSSSVRFLGPSPQSASASGWATNRKRQRRAQTRRYVSTLDAIVVKKSLEESMVSAANRRFEDDWVSKVDLESLASEMKTLASELQRGQGEEDVAHIRKMCRWSNACAAIGVFSMWTAPNPITAMALSLWSFSRWAVIAHHTCHGGYNHNDPTRYFNSKGFALGSSWTRMVQWGDWMLPEVYLWSTGSIFCTVVTTLFEKTCLGLERGAQQLASLSAGRGWGPW